MMKKEKEKWKESKNSKSPIKLSKSEMNFKTFKEMQKTSSRNKLSEPKKSCSRR
jgi:hypothetical protein